MAAGHVDPTIKTNVQNNTIANAVIDATVIHAWRDEISSKIDDNYDSSQTKVPLLTGTGSPNGVVTPTVIGQTYTDRSTGLVYTATALTNTSWIIPYPYNAMNQQAIINAAMEIWQKGTTFTNPTNLFYTADMWLAINAVTGTLPTTIVHSQATLTAGELPNTKYAYNININGAGTGFGVNDAYGVSQKIEFGTSKLCNNGNKITVSMYAKSSIASKRFAVSVTQVYGTGGSPSGSNQLTPTATTIRSLTTSLALYTFTFTTTTLTGKIFGTNNDDYLRIDILEMWGSSVATAALGGGTSEGFRGSGDLTFTEVVVNVGDVALPFQPKSFNEELLACQRYYEKSYNTDVAPASSSASLGIELKIVPSNTVVQSQAYGNTRFKVKKRTNPTITIYPYTTPANTGRVSDNNFTDLAAGSGTTVYIGNDGFVTYNNSGGSVTAVNNSIVFHWVADARL